MALTKEKLYESFVIQVSHPVLFWLLGSWLMISWDRKSSRWMVLLKRLSCSPEPSPEVATADWPEPEVTSDRAPEVESSIMAGNLNSPIFPNSSWVMFVCVEFAWSYLANLWPWLGCASMVPNTANLKGQWLIIVVCGIIDFAKSCHALLNKCIFMYLVWRIWFCNFSCRFLSPNYFSIWIQIILVLTEKAPRRILLQK